MIVIAVFACFAHRERSGDAIRHVVLYARNRDGLRKLYKLVSQSHISCFVNKPLIPRDLLQAHRDGSLQDTHNADILFINHNLRQSE